MMKPLSDGFIAGQISAIRSQAEAQAMAAAEARKPKLLSHKEIVKKGKQVKLVSGIYFLIKRNQIVYIGQAINILRRVAEHRQSGKEFNRYAYVECPADRLDEFERAYLDSFLPPLNRDWQTLRGRSCLGNGLGNHKVAVSRKIAIISGSSSGAAGGD